jgi:signal transduction histidine kinase
MARVLQVIPSTVFRLTRDGDEWVWALFEGQLARELDTDTKDLRGRSVREVFPGGDPEDVLDEFSRALEGAPQDWTDKIQDRYFHFRLQPVRDDRGLVQEIVGCASEVSPLLDDTDEDQLAKDLVNQAMQLRRSHRVAQRLNYTLSHDLRNPLTVIVALSEVASREIRSGTGEPLKRIRKIRQAADRMNEILSDILKLSRSERIAPDRRPVDLSMMSQDILRQLTASQPQRHVDIRVQRGLKVFAEPNLTKDLMENLLANAWKYTSKTDQPRIEVHSLMREGREWICVEDNGIGFSKEEKWRLWEPFNRLPAAQEFHGTGVGLATVKRIVERHGGKVDAWGSPGEGATFCFTLPGPQEAPTQESVDQNLESPLYR